MVKNWISSVLTLFLILTSQLGWALDGNKPVLPFRREIPNAIQISLTPMGQKYFELNFKQILENLGVNLTEGYFDPVTVESKTAVNLDELEKEYPEPAKLLKEVRTVLTQWLVGFTLNDHKPAFQIGNSEYAAEISRLAILMDQKLMTQIGATDGAVIVFEFEIKKLVAQTDQIRVWDQNNPHLGEIGLENVQVTVGQQQSPLHVRLPVYVNLESGGYLNFEVLEVQQNLETLPIEVRYQKLLVPTLVVEMNGRKYPLNNKEIDNLFQQQIPKVLEKTREYINQFAKTDLPKKLNDLAAQHLMGQIEQVQNLPPPGREKDDGKSDFLWGLKLKQMKLQNNLMLGFDAFVEDPDNSKPVTLEPRFGSRQAPNLNTDAQHDVVLSLDRGFINRMIQLSYLRGYFENISPGKDHLLSLRDVPTMDYAALPAGERASEKEAFTKVRIAAETDPDTLFLKDRVILNFDLIAKMVPAESGGIEVIYHSIDMNSVSFDKKYLSVLGRLAPGKVLQGVKDKLGEMVKAWKSQKTTMAVIKDLPPSVLGQKMKIGKLRFDPSGHLVMYLKFESGSDTNQ